MVRIGIKNIVFIFIVLMLSVILEGCGRTQILPKSVEIELGSTISLNVIDYVSVDPKIEKEIQTEARLDISKIETMSVGEYQAIVFYKNQQIVVPVNVIDTTPPIIHAKDVKFQEGDEVEAEDLVEVIDYSNTTMCIISERSGQELSSVWLYPQRKIIIKAVDDYNNEAILEFIPDVIINEEEIGVPIDRIYDSRQLEGFSYEEMEFVDDEIYEKIKTVYSVIKWDGEFERGNEDEFEYYRRKFREFLLFERTFIDSETGEKLTLKDFPPIKIPDGIEATYDMESYKYYFFDMDGDGAQELCIPEVSFWAIFKYDKNKDEIILWKRLDASFYYLGGSRIIFWSNGELNTFCELNDDGTEEMTVKFFSCSYENGTVYCVEMPQYINEEEQIKFSKEVKRQCYYDRWARTYFFRVTEEQYKELTKDYYKMKDRVQEGSEEVTYTYEEMIRE